MSRDVHGTRSAEVLNGGNHGISEGHRRTIGLQVSLLCFMLFWYGILLWASSPKSAPKLDLTFNSMLDHLLHGQFDVDPQMVGSEGFLRNGHVYAYWGIWCALLRFPLWFLGRMNTDITLWSILGSVCLAGMARVRTAILVWRHGAHNRTAKSAYDLMLAYAVLGAGEIGFLKVSIYQEAVSWGAAFAAVFVYFAIKGLITRRFDALTLSWMALCAGLALLTRVSTGVGLILAFGFLLLALAAESVANSADSHGHLIPRILRALVEQRFLLSLGILSICIAATGAVNYFRWGNPRTFADFRFYLMNRLYPDRVARTQVYGVFNLHRIPLGLVYYFFPIWVIRTSGGALLFEQTQARLLDFAELPPSSFLVTDLLPMCFILFLVLALRRRRSVGLAPFSQWAPIAGGLLAPCILMLTFGSMAYRYRMEFYPEIDFLALLGLYAILTDEKLQTKFGQRKVWMEAALIISIICSFTALILYWKAPWGPVQDAIQHGIVHGRFLIL